MKKKAFAILLTAVLVAAQSVSVFAATPKKSPGPALIPGQGAQTSTSGGGGGGGSRTTTTASTPAAGGSSTAATATSTADGQSLSSNGAGSKAANVTAAFAVNEAKTAGLPAAAVTSINRIDAGASLVEAVGNAALTGYSALTPTAAVVLNDTTLGAVANAEVPVSLYIPNLIDSLKNVKILCYENATGLWKVIEPTGIDFVNKTINFNMFGSGTVTIIHN